MVTGSANRDVMAAGTGHDLLLGAGGADVLIAMDGKDTMIGGAGADQFVFMPNAARDVIGDFHDRDSSGDDKIAVQKSLYASMQVVQRGDNVILDFGAQGNLLIKDHTVAEIGRDDFTFHDAIGVLG